MNKKITSMIFLLILSACATPLTVLKHPETGDVVKCGGTTTGSLVGGMIGHEIAKQSAQECSYDYQNRGYKIETYIR